MQSSYPTDSNYWCSSIENALTKKGSSGKTSKRSGDSDKASSQKQVMTEVYFKAIPGGRYGCA